MARITVFTANDVNSRAALAALEQRKLPYVEVNVVEYPSKLKDLQELTNSRAVPKIFFGLRCAGGLQETLETLKKTWDKSTIYKTPLDRYKMELQNMIVDDPKLAVPSTKEASIATKTPVLHCSLPIRLPDYTETSVYDITEKLKQTLSHRDIARGSTVYQLCFAGSGVLKKCQKSLKLTTPAAEKFCAQLAKFQIMNRVCGDGAEKTFESTSIYRLQCYSEPNVLNSYCIWQSGAQIGPVQDDPLQVLSDLLVAMRNITLDCSTDEGRVDYEKAKCHTDLPAFEEAVCELQCLDLSHLAKKEKLAFGLNLYSLMIQYAFLKIGICTSDTERLDFLQKVQFRVNNNTYSFEEWIQQVRTFGIRSSRTNSAKDKMVDCRVHFALNAGAILGGSTSLPFSEFTATNIDDQLDIAAQVFCSDRSNLRIQAELVCISKAIGDYRTDFPGSDEKLFHLVSNYTDAIRSAEMKKLQSAWFSICFVDVAWSSRAVNFRMYSTLLLERKPVKGFKAFLKRFQPPKIGANEDARLAALRKLQILDTLPEERFDRITRMVQKTFEVPFVLISLVDENRQWFKSAHWACPASPEPATQTGRDISFCGHALHLSADDIFIIKDAREDDRFADNPLVTGPTNMVFYAGCPLAVPSEDDDGTLNIGTLCILDTKPRDFSSENKAQLRKFAQLIKTEILRLHGPTKVFNTIEDTSESLRGMTLASR
jgi:hypothetical protein